MCVCPIFIHLTISVAGDWTFAETTSHLLYLDVMCSNIRIYVVYMRICAIILNFISCNQLPSGLLSLLLSNDRTPNKFGVMAPLTYTNTHTHDPSKTHLIKINYVKWVFTKKGKKETNEKKFNTQIAHKRREHIPWFNIVAQWKNAHKVQMEQYGNLSITKVHTQKK